MRPAQKWIVGLALVLLVAAMVLLVIARRIPSDEQLAQRLAVELENRWGVGARIGALSWQLLPSPKIVVENAATLQRQPITVTKITAYPDLIALWQRRLKVDRAELEGAVLPQMSLRELRIARPQEDELPEELPLARFVFRGVNWISLRGIAVMYDGEVDFDAAWRPRKAQLRRPGIQPATDMSLMRQGQDDRWSVQINVGGGTANGEVRLETRANGRLHLGGELQPRDIEVASALAAFNRRSVVGGKASGKTTLTANGDNMAELAQALHTRTLFTMGRSTLLRFDLEKAIRSVGKDYQGQTSLDSITGQLDTQNTAQGMEVEYSGIKAASGALTASGSAKVARRYIEGEFTVDLIDGLVGVPLQLSGPLDAVKVSVPGGAVAGAAIGTVVMPGVGTAIGARLGATIGKIFGGGPEPKPSAPDKAR